VGLDISMVGIREYFGVDEPVVYHLVRAVGKRRV
jgi:hypothetical protein